MKLSIIIVSWNVKDDVLNCLKSIRMHPPRHPYEVIVVDNSSTDGTVDAIKTKFAGVTVIANNTNRGFAAANNQGIIVAQGQYLLLLNPDTLVHPGSLDTLIEFMENNQDVGICGPKILNTDGTTYHSVKRIVTFRGVLYGKTILRFFGVFRGHYRKLKPYDFNYRKQAEVKCLSGAALMVRRSVIDQVGWMDERFFMYYEDVDLCLRIKKLGQRIVFVPEAVITHIGGKSSAGLSTKRRIMEYRSLLIYLRKHKGRFRTALFNLIFKPAAIIGEAASVFSSVISYLFCVFLCNRQKRLKSLFKIKDSVDFLLLYSWQFLFKA